MPSSSMLVCQLSKVSRLFLTNIGVVRRYGHARKMPSALVLLATGAEEMETVISANVMRRGELDVTIAGLEGVGPVKCARDCVLVPDVAYTDAIKKDYDIIVLPGGMGGANALAASAEVGKLLKKQEDRGAHIAAVCAAPIALDSHGIAKGKKLTSHPAVKDTMVKGGYTYSEDRVVVDGKLITSRGPGTCFEFALAIVAELQGKEKSDKLVEPMLVKM